VLDMPWQRVPRKHKKEVKKSGLNYNEWIKSVYKSFFKYYGNHNLYDCNPSNEFTPLPLIYTPAVESPLLKKNIMPTRPKINIAGYHHIINRGVQTEWRFNGRGLSLSL